MGILESIIYRYFKGYWGHIKMCKCIIWVCIIGVLKSYVACI
jgi:hypothetical protein